MKKCISVLCLVLVACFLLTGFTVNPVKSAPAADEQDAAANSGEKTVITLQMHIPDLEAQEPPTYQTIQKFMELNPDIEVQFIGNADQNEHLQKIKMAAQTNSLPDIFWMMNAPALELCEGGYLLDLSDFLEEYPDVASTIIPTGLSANQLDGFQFGLPYQTLIEGIWYNKGIFEEYGVAEPTAETTFDELCEMVKTFAENGVTTFAQGSKSNYSVWPYFTMLCKYGFHDKLADLTSGDLSWNNDDFIHYFEKLDTLRELGAFPANVATTDCFQAVQMFLDGKAAMLGSGVWDAASVADALGDQAGFWWGPNFDDGIGDQHLSCVVSSAPFCVSAAVADDPVKKEAVYRFLAFYYSQDAAQIIIDNNMVPSVSFDESMLEGVDPAFGALIDKVNDPVYTSIPAACDLVTTDVMSKALYDSINGVITGTYSPEDAVDYLDYMQADDF